MRSSHSFMFVITTALIGAFAADGKPQGWSEWIDNDYPCVIECVNEAGFDVANNVPTPDISRESVALACITSRCNTSPPNSLAGNIYQSQYIFSMFYRTGSVYEFDGTPAGTASSTAMEEPMESTTAEAAPVSVSSATAAPVQSSTRSSTVSDPSVSRTQSVGVSNNSTPSNITETEGDPVGTGGSGRRTSRSSVFLAVAAVLIIAILGST